MKQIARIMALCAIIGLLASCNKAAEPTTNTSPTTTAVQSMLSNISGVWRASDGTMVSIVYDDNKLRLLFGADVIPVQVGAMDELNHTTNLKVTLPDGKPGIWTIAQVFNSTDKEAFTLQLTLHDGTQDQLSFVRKVSNDDLNVIAAAESKVHAGSISEAVNQPQVQQPSDAAGFASADAQAADSTATVANAITPSTDSAATNATAWAPSFDCAKASTGPERLICSSRELSAADVALAQAYRAARSSSTDKALLTEQQATWRNTVRDACSDVQCMLNAYEQRTSELH
jgi:uncharacterized protein YecT (DUF1311 family)